MKVNEMEKIQWHPGFYSGLELELREYREYLEFNTEYELSRKPLRMDILIIKKNSNVIIDNPLADFYKTYNIIEYKSPDDGLTIDDFYKVIGYALIYKGLGKTVNKIPKSELSISFYRDSYPRELIQKLHAEGALVEKKKNGIYFIDGIIEIPIYIFVISELDKEHYLALKILKKNASEQDVRQFTSRAWMYASPGDRNNIQAVLEVSTAANMGLYSRIKEDDIMGSALDDLMKDKYEEHERIGIEKGIEQGIEQERLSSVRNVMRSFKVSAEKAMESLGIPKSEYNKYLTML